MISRSSVGRLSRIIRIRSRNLVTVRTLVAICWRMLAIVDYSVPAKGQDRANCGTRVTYIAVGENTAQKLLECSFLGSLWPVPVQVDDLAAAKPARVVGRERSPSQGSCQRSLRPHRSRTVALT